jgi:hypothetical protein
VHSVRLPSSLFFCFLFASTGLRVRPASRQHSAPPVLRAARTRVPSDPQFVTAAANLKLFSHLALSGEARNMVHAHTPRAQSPRRTHSTPTAAFIRDTQSAMGSRPRLHRQSSGSFRPRPATEQSTRTLPKIRGNHKVQSLAV